MKLGDAMYRPGEDGGGDAGTDHAAGAAGGTSGAGGADNVVDADFEEVDEKKRKGSN
jgi:hypothetical protein